MIKDFVKYFIIVCIGYFIVLMAISLIMNSYRNMTQELTDKIIHSECHLIFYPDTQTFINPCSNEIIRSD